MLIFHLFAAAAVAPTKLCICMCSLLLSKSVVRVVLKKKASVKMSASLSGSSLGFLNACANRHRTCSFYNCLIFCCCFTSNESNSIFCSVQSIYNLYMDVTFEKYMKKMIIMRQQTISNH